MSEIVLFSGGVDSTVLLWRALDPVALFVDYGQPSADAERQAVRLICERRGCRFHVMSVDGFIVGAMGAPSGEAGARVVHGRNLMLISLGVNLARSYGAGEVWIGCHGGDSQDYPDCRADFIAAQDRYNRSAYLVGVKAPLMMLSRASFIAEARRTGALDLTWSCYAPTEDGQPCGTCNSCLQPK